jgi:septum formation protein
MVLGSGSRFRRELLENAGLTVEIDRPQIDERAVEKSIEGAGVTPAELAEILAEAKAADVSSRHPGRLVIGCDQTMALEDRLFHKPRNMEDARRHLLALSGRTHELHSAVVLARDGQTIWRNVSTARLTMRDLDPAFIGRHLARVGDKALESVGAYQIEGEGIQLFEKIEGDHFTIVGLPLLPLLAELRRIGAIDG